ncbi:hypothetical protein [Hyphococcus sp.]|jgi:hypothetical protein|uniref:hypothetical protein n=1 Tax=Hyphococcus sp. TaxID=2038636 RepID=UPI003D12DE02
MVGNKVMAAALILATAGLALGEAAVAHHGEDSILGKAGDAITAIADSAAEKLKDSTD